MEAQRFIKKCLVPVSMRASAKELLSDPFLMADGDRPSLREKNQNQKPFLNAKEMEKLHLGEGLSRTNMTITGKLNPEDDTLFLRVQIADKDGNFSHLPHPSELILLSKPDAFTSKLTHLQALLGTYTSPST